MDDFTLNYRTARFWSRVDQSGGPAACWPWTGGTYKTTGYGQATTIRELEGSPASPSTTAHRQAWVLTHGDPGSHVSPRTGEPVKNRVLHRCPGGSVRLCCNPAHLAVGSDQVNADDRASEGRQARGEKMGSAKLTEEQVVEMRARYAAGEGTTSLARAFGVTPATVRPCVRRETWTHVP